MQLNFLILYKADYPEVHEISMCRIPEIYHINAVFLHDVKWFGRSTLRPYNNCSIWTGIMLSNCGTVRKKYFRNAHFL